MENTQLSSKNNQFIGNIYQNNDTLINILDETEFLNKVLTMVVFQLFSPTPVYMNIDVPRRYLRVNWLAINIPCYSLPDVPVLSQHILMAAIQLYLLKGLDVY